MDQRCTCTDWHDSNDREKCPIHCDDVGFIKERTNMDPQETLKNIKSLCSLVESEDPVRMQTLVELEEYLYNLRRWVDKGGAVPEGLNDNR